MQFRPANPSGRRPLMLCLAICLCLSNVRAAMAYVPDERWSTTASGPGGSTGDPLTLTWSLARDGTSIPNEGASNLISYLDSQIGAGPGGSDYTQRPWFNLIEQ